MRTGPVAWGSPGVKRSVSTAPGTLVKTARIGPEAVAYFLRETVAPNHQGAGTIEHTHHRQPVGFAAAADPMALPPWLETTTGTPRCRDGAALPSTVLRLTNLSQPMPLVQPGEHARLAEADHIDG